MKEKWMPVSPDGKKKEQAEIGVGIGSLERIHNNC